MDPLGKTRDVTVRLAPEARERITDLEQLPLVVGGAGGAAAGAGATGGAAETTAMSAPATVPLGQVATIRRSLGRTAR